MEWQVLQRTESNRTRHVGMEIFEVSRRISAVNTTHKRERIRAKLLQNESKTAISMTLSSCVSFLIRLNRNKMSFASLVFVMTYRKKNKLK